MYFERSYCWNYDEKGVEKYEEIPIITLHGQIIVKERNPISGQKGNNSKDKYLYLCSLSISLPIHNSMNFLEV